MSVHMSFGNNVAVVLSVVQPDVDNCLVIKTFKYSILFVVVQGFSKFPIIFKLLILF